jgi:hypothetical protein
VEEDHEAQGEGGQDDDHEGACHTWIRYLQTLPGAPPTRAPHGQHRDGGVDHPSLPGDALGGQHIPRASRRGRGCEHGRVESGRARRRAREPRRHEGDDHHQQQREPSGSEQIEARRRRRAFDLHPVEGETQRPRIGGCRIDREDEGSAAVHRWEVRPDLAVSHARVGLDVERRDEAPLDSHCNSSWINEMASHARGQSVSFAREQNGKPHFRVARGPVKARQPIALPVLAEPGDVIEVVGAEVQDGGPCMVGGEGGEEPCRRCQHEEHGEVRGDPANRAGVRPRRRRAGYVVTSTAA